MGKKTRLRIGQEGLASSISLKQEKARLIWGITGSEGKKGKGMRPSIGKRNNRIPKCVADITSRGHCESVSAGRKGGQARTRKGTGRNDLLCQSSGLHYLWLLVFPAVQVVLTLW